MLDMFAITLALMVGTAGLPHVIVRFFTVPRVHDARTSAGWALLFIAILYTTAPAVGAMARMNLTNTVMGPDLTGAEYTAMPGWFKTWEKTGLLKFDDKNKDGKIQYYDDKTKNQAAAASFTEKGWKGNELTVDRDIMVLANPRDRRSAQLGHQPWWPRGPSPRPCPPRRGSSWSSRRVSPMTC